MKKIVKITIPILIIIGVIIVFVVRSQTKAPEFSSVKVERVDLVQSVEETGAIAASNDVTYGFELGGKVILVNNEVGDMVSSTDIIAELNNTVEVSSLNQARAALAKAQAALNLELAGPSNEEISESLAKVNKAKASLDQVKIQLDQVRAQNTTKINNAERTLQDADSDLRRAEDTDISSLVADAVQDLFNSLQASIPTISDGLRESDNILGIDNTQANDEFETQLASLNKNTINIAKANYTQSKTRSLQAQNSLNLVTNQTDEASVVGAYTVVLDSLTKNRTLLTSVKSVLDSTVSGGNLTETELNTMKSDILTELSNTNTKITTITDNKQSVDEAKTSLDKKQTAYNRALDALEETKNQANVDEAVAMAKVSIEESALAQTEAAHQNLIAPPRAVDVASLRADVTKNAAAVAAAEQEVEKKKLRAITSGVVAKLDIDVGDTITANSDAITIISSQRTIEVDVSESDIAKVMVEDPVEITLDAFGDDIVFNGIVRAIEPAETEISGVIYYNTDVTLLVEDDSGIRPGMTANIKIITETKENVLVVPQRSIIREDGKQFVRVVTSKERGTFDKKEIQTGLRGDDGFIEVTNGINEGDEVITFLKEG